MDVAKISLLTYSRKELQLWPNQSRSTFIKQLYCDRVIQQFKPKSLLSDISHIVQGDLRIEFCVYVISLNTDIVKLKKTAIYIAHLACENMYRKPLKKIECFDNFMLGCSDCSAVEQPIKNTNNLYNNKLFDQEPKKKEK